jgi:hypothetical protein
VADLEATSFLSYFRIGGDPPGIVDCCFQALNECIGDWALADELREIAGRKPVYRD